MKNQSFYLLVLTLGLFSFLFSNCDPKEEEDDDLCIESEAYITVYQDDNYGGPGQVFGIGEYMHTALTVVGNDKISSFEVSLNNCVKVTLCEHSNLNNLGICKVYESDQPTLAELNNKVSYIKVELR